MSSDMETKEGSHPVDVQHAEVLANPDLMKDAFAAEEREHEMGTWEAVKKHPKACFWAFIMCFTIVSDPTPYTGHHETICTRITEMQAIIETSGT